MTQREREKAKAEKLREIEFSANRSLMLEAANCLEMPDEEEIKVERRGKSDASLKIKLGALKLEIPRWKNADGIDSLFGFFRILKENEGIFLRNGSPGKIRFEIEEKLGEIKGFRHEFSFSKTHRRPDFLNGGGFPNTEKDAKSLGIELNGLSGGRFKMGGSTFTRNILVQDFSISRNLVTQRQFLEVMGDEASEKFNPDGPCTNASWVDSVIFCNRLSEIEGKIPCYFADEKCDSKDLAALASKIGEESFAQKVHLVSKNGGFRLPTESEFEYALQKRALSPKGDETEEWLWDWYESIRHESLRLQYSRRNWNNGTTHSPARPRQATARDGGFRVAASD